LPRVTFLIPTLDRSGAEKQLVLLATGLPRDRFAPEVIVLTRSGPLEEDLHRAGIPVTLLGKRGKVDPRTLRSLKKTLRENSPDILHTWLFAANAYGRLATPKRRSFRTVVSERCVDSWKARWQLWLDRRLLARTDVLLGNSESVAKFYEEQGIPRSLISVIPNAVVPPPQPAMNRSEFLKSLGFAPETRLIGVIGRLAKQKRVDDLLWGMHARDVEVADFVKFLGHRDDAASLVHHLDVFWLGSSFEGMSNSLMEAMAAGTPVIATDIPPNRELITHGTHGFLPNVGDGVAFAQYTVKLFGDAELRQKLVAAARDRMQGEFSVDRMIERHVHLYENVLKAQPAT